MMIICRQDNDHHRYYLQLRDTSFIWLDTEDFESWHACAKSAIRLDQLQCAIVLRLLRLENVDGAYTYEALEVLR